MLILREFKRKFRQTIIKSVLNTKSAEPITNQILHLFRDYRSKKSTECDDSKHLYDFFQYVINNHHRQSNPIIPLPNRGMEGSMNLEFQYMSGKEISIPDLIKAWEFVSPPTPLLNTKEAKRGLRTKLELLSTHPNDSYYGFARAKLKCIKSLQKYRKYASYFEQYNNINHYTVDESLKKYLIGFSHVDFFITRFSKECMKIMFSYYKTVRKMTGKYPNFYVLTNKAVTGKMILLAQSPFDFYWQKLGVFDLESRFEEWGGVKMKPRTNKGVQRNLPMWMKSPIEPISERTEKILSIALQ